MPAAARQTDFHSCIMVSTTVPPTPHVGGPITQVIPTVLIGGLPAATVGSMCMCIGPQDTISKGYSTIFIGGMPAARMGDTTAHGGSISAGLPTVQIGG